MSKIFSIFLVVLALQVSAFAGEFDFKDPKSVQSVSFSLSSKFEPLSGLASGISGKLTFDGKDFKSIKGKISLDVKSIYLPNVMMAKKLMGKVWLNAKDHPTIDFDFKSVESVTKISDTEAKLKVKCVITLKGVSQKQTIDLHVAYYADGLGNRVQKAKGDLLVLKSKFSISRGAFGIMKDKYLPVVADKINIEANLVGSLFKK